jgi:hypothetical protein
VIPCEEYLVGEGPEDCAACNETAPGLRGECAECNEGSLLLEGKCIDCAGNSQPQDEHYQNCLDKTGQNEGSKKTTGYVVGAGAGLVFMVGVGVVVRRRQQESAKANGGSTQFNQEEPENDVGIINEQAPALSMQLPAFDDDDGIPMFQRDVNSPRQAAIFD